MACKRLQWVSRLRVVIGEQQITYAIRKGIVLWPWNQLVLSLPEGISTYIDNVLLRKYLARIVLPTRAIGGRLRSDHKDWRD